MKPLWQGVIAVLLVASFFSIAGVVGYQLYGEGIHFDIPDYLLPAGWATTTERVAENDPLSEYAGTLFECEGGKALKVELGNGNVRLALSDGRQVSLPQSASSDGERYTNANESFVFWNKGITAYVEENGVQTYASCLQI